MAAAAAPAARPGAWRLAGGGARAGAAAAGAGRRTVALGRLLRTRWTGLGSAESAAPASSLVSRLTQPNSASSAATGSGSKGALWEWMRLAAAVPTATAEDIAKTSDALARQLKAASSVFRSADIVQIMSGACRLSHRHPPLLDAVAAHVLRGMPAYPVFAICNVANCFGRLEYHHKQLMDAVAAHLAQPERAEQLTPIDIASLVYAYAQLGHQAGELLEVCVERLGPCASEVGGPNAAIILNSYARLSECNPKLFHNLSRSLIKARPENFDVHHISLTMNAFAKCSVRKPQLMYVLGGYLDGRIEDLSPQNVSNVVHAFAKVECYNHELFYGLQKRITAEDLTRYKLYELAIMAHSLAKLKCGGKKIYGTLFAEFSRRAHAADQAWEPQSVVQVLDASWRRRAYFDEALVLALMGMFLKDFSSYRVHPLTQAAWCLVELDALELAARLPLEVVQASEGESPSLCLMRRVFERLEELNLERTLTATQQQYVQQLIRVYHFKHEVDYGLLPPRCKAFCKSMFDTPTPVVAAVARQHRRPRDH